MVQENALGYSFCNASVLCGWGTLELLGRSESAKKPIQTNPPHSHPFPDATSLLPGWYGKTENELEDK